MKFAQYLNDHAVPEWKTQYLDYKQGKKKLKKINDVALQSSSSRAGADAHNNNNSVNSAARAPGNAPHRATNTPLAFPSTGLKHRTPSHDVNTPSSGRTTGQRSSMMSFQLPPPAIANPPPVDDGQNAKKPQQNDRTPLLVPLDTVHQDHQLTLTSNTPASATLHQHEPLLRRRSRIGSFVKTVKDNLSTPALGPEHELSSFADFAKQEFLSWCDGEMYKVESFYRDTEHRTVERYLLLQDQLVKLREHRKMKKLRDKYIQGRKNHVLDEHLAQNEAQHLAQHSFVADVNQLTHSARHGMSKINKWELPSLPSLRSSLRQKQYYDEGFYSDDDDDNASASDDTDSVKPSHLPTVSDPRFNRRDYARHITSIPYYVLRRQLKTAVLELYRSLELLKSYRMLNRTAFRKMLKKFDKTTRSALSSSYMLKVEQCYFNRSEVTDELINRLEELFAATFENGNRKSAVTKLRSSEVLKTFYTALFSSGWLLGFAFPLFVLLVYKGIHDTLRGILPEGKFLLQIWGGFFLPTLMLLLFLVNCAAWTSFKINYKFIFEFDARTLLDFKQFLLLPSLSMFLLLLFGWFSFENFWPTQLPGRYWPWFYVGFMLVVMFCPFKVLFYPSRRWILNSVWRLLLSGFYPVEFRDFFLGDLFCSLTYTMSNISFFFCLYGTHWDGALTGGNTKCGSQNSRLMGFLLTLPSIWRFMQCIRRYSDTRDWFPHLANCMKYTISVVYYALLSVYRIDRTVEHRAVFIVFALINSIYSSIWDIFMDWSLMQAGSKNFLLRDDLIFKKSFYYYIAMVLDVVLRFQWIFYAFFKRQVQQSAVTSFCIALLEILRRFIWVFFRLENEHCTNVHLFRASRETPVPYPINKASILQLLEEYEDKIAPMELLSPVGVIAATRPDTLSGSRRSSAAVSEHDLPADHSGSSSTHGKMSRRATVITQSLARFSHALNSAHIKDFQRRKPKREDAFQKDESDDEDDEIEDSDEDEEARENREENELVAEYIDHERNRQ